MDVTTIARALGAVLLIVAAAALGASALAALGGAFDHARGFMMTAVAGGFFGGVAVIAAAGRPDRGGAREALVFLAGGWLLAPALAAAPFFLYAPDAGAVRAYADAVSAMTTTGFPPAFAGDGAPQSLVYWWVFLQWLGGGATVITALVVLAALDLTGPGVHRSMLFTLEPERLFHRFGIVARSAGGLYAMVTVVVFLGAWIGGAEAGSAFCSALAAISTGGLLLPDGSVTAASLPAASLCVLAAGVLFGSLNFALHYDAFRGRPGAAYLEDNETRMFVAFAVLVTLAVMAADEITGAGHALRGAFEAFTLAATAGWDVGAVGVAALPPVFIALIVIVGGSPVSTAGGVKVVRALLLLRQASEELKRLAHPSAVTEVRYRGRALPARAILGVLIYVAGFALAGAASAMLLAAAEAPFPVAFAGATAALANAGPAADLIAPGSWGLLAASQFALITLSATMIVGRVEVLAAMALLAPSFWRR